MCVGIEPGSITHLPLQREFLPVSLGIVLNSHTRVEKVYAVSHIFQGRSVLFLYLYHYPYPGSFFPVKETLDKDCGW